MHHNPYAFTYYAIMIGIIVLAIGLWIWDGRKK